MKNKRGLLIKGEKIKKARIYLAFWVGILF
jgi:hypothetical protein